MSRRTFILQMHDRPPPWLLHAHTCPTCGGDYPCEDNGPFGCKAPRYGKTAAMGAALAGYITMDDLVKDGIVTTGKTTAMAGSVAQLINASDEPVQAKDDGNGVVTITAHEFGTPTKPARPFFKARKA